VTSEKGGTVAFFFPYLNPVGVEPAMLALAAGLTERNYRVDLLRAYREWQDVPEGVGRVVGLGSRHCLPWMPRTGRGFKLSVAVLSAVALPWLIRYLRQARPDYLIAGLLTAVAMTAVRMARVDTRVVVSVQGYPRSSWLRRCVWRWTYKRADAIVAESLGSREQAAALLDVPEETIAVIYNPHVTPDIARKAKERLDHPWFARGEHPVLLGVGRLTQQKDFATLLRAFALVREQLPCKLLVLGEGEERPNLGALAGRLGVADHVHMPGHVENPYPYMAKAGILVSSSGWEGLVRTLIEGLVIGVPVVATDCPGGTREILDRGSAGRLVRIGDHQGLAAAMVETLRDVTATKQLVARGRRHVRRFQVAGAVDAYAELLKGLRRGE
jgi:glycosyltransferase involved in cell wall biosynthesis